MISNLKKNEALWNFETVGRFRKIESYVVKRQFKNNLYSIATNFFLTFWVISKPLISQSVTKKNQYLHVSSNILTSQIKYI